MKWSTVVYESITARLTPLSIYSTHIHIGFKLELPLKKKNVWKYYSASRMNWRYSRRDLNVWFNETIKSWFDYGAVWLEETLANHVARFNPLWIPRNIFPINEENASQKKFQKSFKLEIIVRHHWTLPSIPEISKNRWEKIVNLTVITLNLTFRNGNLNAAHPSVFIDLFVFITVNSASFSHCDGFIFIIMTESRETVNRNSFYWQQVAWLLYRINFIPIHSHILVRFWSNSNFWGEIRKIHRYVGCWISFEPCFLAFRRFGWRDSLTRS